MATKEEFDDAIKLIVQRKKYTFSVSVGRLMMDDAWWNLANAKNGIMQNVLLRLFMMTTKAGFANLALNFCIHTIKYVAIKKSSCSR